VGFLFWNAKCAQIKMGKISKIRRFTGKGIRGMWPPSILLAILLLAASASGAQQKPLILRVGYFPNITHAQALVGRAGGQFEKAVGPGVQIEWKAFNAGPSAIEALFANAIDLTYVGPNPTVTGYVRSQGDAVRVIAGAASGGASLVVRRGARRGLGSRAVGGAPGS
jgi:NitT/TauT family transport system substrate-binding protein